MKLLATACLMLASAPLPVGAEPVAPAVAVQDWLVQLAPFDAIRWPDDGEQPEVRVDGAWYGWLALDDVVVADIVAVCQDRWPSRWRKRVGEDLVEALVLMGKVPGREVRLTLTELERGEEVVLEKVAMTKAKRRAVREFNHAARAPAAAPGPSSGPAIGARAPEIVGRTLDGERVELSGLRGKVVLVDFFASWCAPCLAELPALRRAHDAWEARGFVIVGVSLDDASAKAALGDLLKAEQVDWPVLFEGETKHAAAAGAYGVKAIPASFLVDREGLVRARDLRGTHVEAIVGQLVTSGAVELAKLPPAERVGSPQGAGKRKDDDVPKRSPFTAVRREGEDYQVQLDGAWFVLVTLNGIPAADYRAFCLERFGAIADKRFSEDLAEVLQGMGQSNFASADLVLRPVGGGAEVTREDVPMTAANRRAVWSFNNGGSSLPRAAVRRVEREHAAAVAPAFEALARFLVWPAWSASPSITRAQAEADLDQLEWSVEHTHSYRELRGVDWRTAFDAVRAGLLDRVPVDAFAVQLAKLTALLGDGHAGVRGGDGRLPGECLPFLLAEADGGVVAFLPDRSALLDPEHPFVAAIDGRPIEEWIATGASIVPAGSASNERFRGLRNLRRFGWARLELGEEVGSLVHVELVDATGRSKRALDLELAARKPIYGPWPRRVSGVLDGDVGYLRVESMSGDADDLRAVVDAMDAFRETRGLVIDVRGNGGGTRDSLRALLPYFLDADAPPQVVNVAAYRLTPDDEPGAREGYMSNRFLYPASSTRWSEAERAAIAACAAGFAPDWTLPAGEFSAWHYFVIGARDGGAAAYRYERPVVVLVDTGCFSATDIFLGAFEGLPGVTLMGTPSGGGSGRSQGLRLAHSGLELRLSTMASFRPDGRRYDGLGVEPDVRVVPAATDLLAAGTDATLEAALERIRKAD